MSGNDPGCVKTRTTMVLAQGKKLRLWRLFDARRAFDTNQSCARTRRSMVFTQPRPKAAIERASRSRRPPSCETERARRPLRSARARQLSGVDRTSAEYAATDANDPKPQSERRRPS